MQEVPGVVRRVELAGRFGIANDLIEVDNSVEKSGSPDERVDTLAGLLPGRVGVRLDGSVGWGSGEWSDGSSEDGDAEGVDTGDDLLEGSDEAVADVLLGCGGVVCDTDVVDAFEDHRVLDAGLCEDVAVDTADRIRSESVGEDAVTTGSLVQNSDVGG